MAQNGSDELLMPPGANVVLLSGLPGDVESESAYREQMQGWIEVAAKTKPNKLTVLCDDPASLAMPQGIHGSASKADRSNFLAVAREVSATGTTNTLVVVAWGHGGRQGKTPVLHVRGPRLTPSDFVVIAPKGSDILSHWILMFRGSGAFARALAGEKRKVLASEHLTAFNSDPAGMPLLLKLARSGKVLGFEALSRAFGQAASTWYEERNVARTEEPTLWVGGGDPLRLAEAGSLKSGASGPNRDPTDELRTTEANREKGERKEEQGSSTIAGLSGLSEAWKGIQRVAAGQFPGVQGVTLCKRLNYVLGANPAVTTEQEEFIQVLTPDGKHLGDFDVSFSPPFEEVSFQDCEVLSPDGRLTRLDPDEVREAREQSVGDYQVGRRKFFSLPGVMPGAILHIRYRTQWKSFPLPHVSLEIPIAADLPVIEGSIQVTVPRDSAFHFAAKAIALPHPTVKQTAYGTSYHWSFTNVPPHREEALSVPGREPGMLISTFPDWKSFSEWYARITQLTTEATPEISSKAAELTRGARTDRERVLALYNYVTGLRYVAVPLGVSSFRPHAAANVLENQYGDCKDKATLFNTLLRSLKRTGMGADLVLVPRFSQAHTNVPGFAFNHAISRVRLGDEVLWVDTTDDVCRFGLLPPGDPGRNVLVVDGQSQTLTQLPVPDAKDHQLELRAELDFTRPNDTVPITLVASAQGYADYEMRDRAKQGQEQGGSLPLLSGNFRPVSGALALEKQSATAASALDQDFQWQGEGKWIGISANLGGKRLLHSPFWIPREWDHALHQRELPLYLNQGYPLTMNEEFVFRLAPGVRTVVLPDTAENKTAPLRWRIGWERNADEKLVARFRAELVKGELSMEETTAFQEQVRALVGALAGAAELSGSSSQAASIR